MATPAGREAAGREAAGSHDRGDLDASLVVSTVAVTRAARVRVTRPSRLLALDPDGEGAAGDLGEAERVVHREALRRRRGAREVVGGRDLELPAPFGGRRRLDDGRVGGCRREGDRIGPGCCRSVSVKATAPPGATRVAVTFEGRTTLYESSRCFSASRRRSARSRAPAPARRRRST